MSRARTVVGLVAGVMLVASAFAHSLAGGSALRQELAPFNVSADLMRGLMVGWHFGGACMIAFGAIVLTTFARRMRGGSDSTMPPLVIGLVYLAFGGWALSTSPDPFFLVFIVPGVLLTWASRP